MTYGVTSTGFKAKRFTDIVTEIGEALKTELGIDIDSNPDSVAKILTNIYSLPLADEWAATQALQSMFDIDKAEGKHLDDLVGYVGLRRLQSAASFGKEYISSSQTVTIPSGSTFKDASGNKYINSSSIVVTKENCVNLTLVVDTGVTVGSILTLTINTVISTITVATTVANAVNLLVADITNKTNSNKVTATDTSVGSVLSLSIVSNDDTVPAIINTSNNLLVYSITSFGTVAKDVVGNFGVSANTVTVPPAIVGITSVTNRYLFVEGRNQESDIDLRDRHRLSVSTAGAATVEAITADILGVAGVITALGLEKDTLVTSADNIPPKSFLAIVTGGADQDIGNALWLTKGAGIESFGSTQVTIIDSQGSTQFVNFSRPEPIYIHLNVDYSLYDEQSDQFPTNGEQLMSDILVEYGTGLGSGEDVIPQRLATQLFNSIGGLGTVNITAGSTVGPNDPTPILTANILPIGRVAEADFDALRITINEV